MSRLGDAFVTALQLLTSLDRELAEIVLLSLRISLSAVALAVLIGMPLGAALALARVPGRGALVVLLNACMGLPPVVVGLFVYLMLSRAGPLGELGLLFTPTAMVIAQALLVTPIIAALTRQTVEDLHAEYREQLHSLGVGALRAIPTLLWDGRFSLMTAVLAGWAGPWPRSAP
jgi:tungstate transport system permease protein